MEPTTPPPVTDRRLVFTRRVILVCLLLAAIGLAGVAHHLLRRAPGDPQAPPATVIIERGWGLSKIARVLEQARVIADARGFELLARYKGATSALKAGEYAIPYGQRLSAVLVQLREGRTVLHQFTVIPGWTARQVAQQLQKAGIDSGADAFKLIIDPSFAKSLSVPVGKLEGFLLPETYTYERGDAAAKLLTQMVRQFQRVWTERLAARVTASGMTELQIVTLASIVEKEAGDAAERPKVARVFLNRLKAGMPLQADPTVIYALGDGFDGNLTRANLQTDHPYNTYTRKGLPPGPICSPSVESMEAVLTPADGSWLYFVADGAGHHVFSENLTQHSIAVERYQIKNEK